MTPLRTLVPIIAIALALTAWAAWRSLAPETSSQATMGEVLGTSPAPQRSTPDELSQSGGSPNAAPAVEFHMSSESGVPTMALRPSNLTARSSKTALLRAGLAATDKDAVLLVYWTLALSCPGVRGEGALNEKTETEKRSAYELLLGPGKDSIVDSSFAARRRLMVYCGAQEDELEKQFGLRFSAARKSGPGRWYHAKGLSKGGDAAQHTLTVLSNPEKYPAAFDMWLRFGLSGDIAEMQQMDAAQKNWIEDYLYHQLTNTPQDAESLRTLQRCASEMWCPESSPLQGLQLEQARLLALRIERLIREQRWTDFQRP